MVKLIHKLIVRKLVMMYEFLDFECTNYFTNCFLSMFITPKHLKLAAGGGLKASFFNNLLEGYRTPLPIKIHQTTQLKKPIKQGGARKVLL